MKVAPLTVGTPDRDRVPEGLLLGPLSNAFFTRYLGHSQWPIIGGRFEEIMAHKDKELPFQDPVTSVS